MHKFLGNIKNPYYKTILERLLVVYEAQGYKTSFKVHFLHSHMDYILKNLEACRTFLYLKDVLREMACQYLSRWILNRETKEENRKRAREASKEKNVLKEKE